MKLKTGSLKATDWQLDKLGMTEKVRRLRTGSKRGGIATSSQMKTRRGCCEQSRADKSSSLTETTGALKITSYQNYSGISGISRRGCGAQGQSRCPACTTSWVQSPVLPLKKGRKK